MTQSPVTVTYSLEEVLARLERKIDERFDEVNQKLEGLQKNVTDLKVGQAEFKGDIKALDTKIDGIGKRLENQEFISRGVLIALIVAILGGFAKLFGIVGNP